MIWGTTWDTVRVCDAPTLTFKRQRKLLRTFYVPRGYEARTEGVVVEAVYPDSLKRPGWTQKVSDFPWPNQNT